MSTITTIKPRTKDSPSSFYIKINQVSILINCPAGTQRFINSYGLNFNTIKYLILTDVCASTLEGLLGLLMTMNQSANKPSQITIFSPNDHPMFQNMNSFAVDPVFGGKVVIIADQLVFKEIECDLLLKNVNGILYFQIDSFLEKQNLKKEEIKRLKIPGNLMKKFLMEKRLEFNGSKLNLEDFYDDYQHAGVISYNLSFESQFPSVFYFDDNVTSEQVASIQRQNPMNICLYDILFDEFPGYQILDFCTMFKNQTDLDLYPQKLEKHFNQSLLQITTFPIKQFALDYLQYNEEKSYQKIPMQYPIDQVIQLVNVKEYFIITLGTGASVPNKYNNVAGYLLKLNFEYILVDCGEATLQQLLIAQKMYNFSCLDKISHILITHEHADHFLGLGTLVNFIQSQYNYTPVFTIPETPQHYLSMFIRQTPRNFIASQLEINAIPNYHSPQSVSYHLSHQNKQIVISGDCRPQSNLKQLKNIDLFLHEATFGQDQQDEAEKRLHSTLKEALDIVQNASVSVLTHFSQRNAKEVFVLPPLRYQAFDFAIFFF